MFRHLARIGTTSCLIPFLAYPAFAASDDEIIVTAMKTNADPLTLGVSIAVVDGEALANTDGAEELSQHVAGLQAAVANGSQIAFQIRGIGAVDHQALTPTAAAVYVDGTFMATNVQTSPLLFDLERAEVLKGPQGSLYGRNATAGAINFISKRPEFDHGGYIGGEVGNFDRVNLKAAINTPVNEKIALRLAGRYLSQGPLLENVQTDPAIAAPENAGGKRDEFGLRLTGLIAHENTNVILNMHYAEDNGINANPRNEALPLGEHEISVGPSGVQDTDNEFYGIGITAEHDFGSASLTSHTAFEGYNQQYGFDFGARPLVFGTQTNANLSYDRNLAQISNETRINFQRDRLDALVGIYLEAEDFDQDYRVYCGDLNPVTLVGSCNYIAAASRVGAAPTPAGASASTLQSIIEQTRKTGALFTHNTFALSPRFDLIFGGRLTHERIEGEGEGRHIFTDGTVGINNRSATDGSGNTVFPGPARGQNLITETRFSGNVGLNAHIGETMLAYISYANGFKSGGFNGEVINNATHFDDAGLFGPEQVDSFEAGLKSKQGPIQFELAGFYNFYSDPQARFFENVTLDDGTIIGLNSLSNFDKARSFGLDASAAATPIEGLDLRASISLIDTEIDDESQTGLDGNNLPFASAFSGTASLRYEFPIGADMKAILQTNGKYQSRFNMDASGRADYAQDGYEVIDASAKIRLSSQTEIGIWGRNLTNSDYAVSAYQFSGATTFRGSPRQYGVSLHQPF